MSRTAAGAMTPGPVYAPWGHSRLRFTPVSSRQTFAQLHTECPCLLICRSHGTLKFPRDHRGLGLLSRERLQGPQVFLRPRPELYSCLLRHFRSPCANNGTIGRQKVAAAERKRPQSLESSGLGLKCRSIVSQNRSLVASGGQPDAENVPTKTKSSWQIDSALQSHDDSRPSVNSDCLVSHSNLHSGV